MEPAEGREKRPARTSVTLLDGTELKVGDPCRAKVCRRWRTAVVTDVMQGSGVDRAYVRLSHPGAEPVLVSRYDLRPPLKRPSPVSR